jgi:4-hydroxybenzoate polyprenyltransferase
LFLFPVFLPLTCFYFVLIACFAPLFYTNPIFKRFSFLPPCLLLRSP